MAKSKKREDPSPILLLSGPPGAGKSTVAKAFVAASAGPTVCIEGDKFWTFFVRQPPPAELGEEPRFHHFRTMMWSMTTAAIPYARAGYETIVDFSFPWWFIDPFRARFPDLLIDFVVLLPPESVCAARAAARPEGTINDYNYMHQLYASFGPVPKPYIIDNETLEPGLVAAAIRTGVTEGRFRLPPRL